MIFLLFIAGVTLANLLGHSSGLRDGYRQGHKEADDWWIDAESQIEAERCRDRDEAA